MPSSKSHNSSFDPASFLTKKIAETDEQLLSLQEEQSRTATEEARLKEELARLDQAISKLEAERTSFQQTLDHLGSAEDDGAGEVAPAPAASQTTRNGRPDARRKPTSQGSSGMTVADQILTILSENARAEWTVKELVAELPKVSPKVISNTILKMHSRGSIKKVGRGRYKIATGATE